ncbi:PXA domain-containing protein [Apiospora phragmitis]|uniref:PXA domain-containing protein n=1 Tax=Apiospora phragmitis TaxID=2905665 RepID=A0ABR1TRQ1_9PEZI
MTSGNVDKTTVNLKATALLRAVVIVALLRRARCLQRPHLTTPGLLNWAAPVGSNVTSAANSRDPVKTTAAAPGAGSAFIKAGEAGGVAPAAASVISKERPSSATVDAGVDGFAPEATPLQCHEDDDRILSEIETGILDVFSDAYCNKHLMYGVLELILVRLMPELAERGVIDLWEERLS